MRSRYVTSWTFVMLAILVGSMAAPVLASQVHPVCVSHHHDCGTTARFVECCCGDQHSTSDEGGPIQSRLQLDAKLTADPGVAVDLVIPDSFRPAARPDTSPPRAHAPDLPTLFASLLI